MDYTNDILKILSTELEPYSTVDGQVCIDGVLTSAQKLNEFIQQLLQQTPCKTHVCACGNELTEKELFYETCLKCEKTV